MKACNTGLVKILCTSRIKRLLKRKNLQLYNFFYNGKGEIIEKNIKKMLLADNEQLKNFIKEFGKIPKKQSGTLVKEVFRYDTFSKRDVVFDILKTENVSVCPYCNRQYIFTLDDNTVRAQFDHYYPKSIYPYLAVSIFNLIPCCSICNQTKQSLDTYENPILYPFEDEFGDEARFRMDSNDIKYLQGMTDNFKIYLNLNEISGDKLKKIKNQNGRLRLEEFYEMHKDYVKDIARNHYLYSDDRINELMNMFPNLF